MNLPEIMEAIAQRVEAETGVKSYVYKPECDKMSYMPDEEGGPCGWCDKPYAEHPDTAPSITFERT